MLPVVVVTVLSMVVTPSAVMVTVPEAAMGWLVSSPAAESRTTLPAEEVISSETEPEKKNHCHYKVIAVVLQYFIV